MSRKLINIKVTEQFGVNDRLWTRWLEIVSFWRNFPAKNGERQELVICRAIV